MAGMRFVSAVFIPSLRKSERDESFNLLWGWLSIPTFCLSVQRHHWSRGFAMIWEPNPCFLERNQICRLSDPLAVPHASPFLLWLLQLIQKILEESKSLLKTPLKVQWIAAEPQLELHTSVQVWSNAAGTVGIPPQILMAPCSSSTCLDRSDLASYISQLYGNFEEVRQKHPHSWDRDIYQVFYMCAGPSCALTQAGIQQVSDVWLWQKTMLLISFLSWNPFETEAIIVCGIAPTHC